MFNHIFTLYSKVKAMSNETFNIVMAIIENIAVRILHKKKTNAAPRIHLIR